MEKEKKGNEGEMKDADGSYGLARRALTHGAGEAGKF
jgi:hypothetical protein